MSNQREPATRVLCEAEKEETKVSGAWVLLAEWAAGVPLLCFIFAGTDP